ncbi:DUF3089 domain-containing protein [Flavobacterium lacus]|uniref:Putative secreted protein (Por secretion system target) n=1 Tax=Flavobacterium lacus TaxID=1353778 RepID=A0A328X785_9FLAO|nr:DUF3089 domain-containing protein [Flavobacterium lacus]RAR51159.1 putative secreted protein (Por secretion system target) [Flavobacterium lacus]
MKQELPHQRLLTLIFLFFFSGLVAQTDYSNMTNWAYHPGKPATLLNGANLDIAVVDENLTTTSVISITNNAMINTGVDVFFIHPTVLQNLGSYTEIETIPIANQNSFLVAASIRGQAGLLAKYGRFFAPRYRQATPPTFLTSPTDLNQATILGVAYTDVKDAFLHYLATQNNGNKIIIASHSQGAYLAGFLLSEVFDSNPELRQQLVVAVVAGMVTNYAQPDLVTGGWWQNIPFCTEQNECGCVMNWRSYKEGQTPPAPLASHPCLNPFVVSNGWANSLMNFAENQTSQDSLYYSDESQPLRNFITLRNNVDFGGNVGYVAFDNLYSIRHQRSAFNRVGFVVQHTPGPNDLRPNLLEEEESNPSFSIAGYHQKDYNIYTWALLEQIDLKIANCSAPLSLNDTKISNQLTVFPNPANEWLFIQMNKQPLPHEPFFIYNSEGSQVKQRELDNESKVSVQDLSEGFYIIKTLLGVGKVMVLRR